MSSFLTSLSPDTNKIKLSNFEESMLSLTVGKPHYTYTAEPSYLPPEHFIHGKHMPLQSTVWAIGSILFELVFARRPLFVTANDFKTLEGLFSRVSPECIRFLRGCLCPSPGERLRFSEVREQPWFNDEIIL